jgi:hypothetical protein
VASKNNIVACDYPRNHVPIGEQPEHIVSPTMEEESKVTDRAWDNLNDADKISGRR